MQFLSSIFAFLAVAVSACAADNPGSVMLLTRTESGSVEFRLIVDEGEKNRLVSMAERLLVPSGEPAMSMRPDYWIYRGMLMDGQFNIINGVGFLANGLATTGRQMLPDEIRFIQEITRGIAPMDVRPVLKLPGDK